MHKLFPFLLLGAISISVKAQTQPALPATQPYGKIDMADLELKSCGFEPDANAEVLFDTEDVFYDRGFNIDRHKRVKIFNDKGNYQASDRIEYYSYNGAEYITDFEAETINLIDGKIVITKIDKKQIFTQRVDARYTSLAFAFPNIKAGSVIEYKYRVHTPFVNIPVWRFQSELPERYSEVTTEIPDIFYYKVQLHLHQPLVSDAASAVPGNPFNFDKHIRGMANVPAFREEPFLSSPADNIQSVYFYTTGVRGNGNFRGFFDSWGKAAQFLIDDKYFGYEMNTNVAGQMEILKNANLLATSDLKVAYIFNEVKNKMRWNNFDAWYTEDGLSKAWDLKAGNSTEINLILHSLLTSAGVEAFPFMVSTHAHGKVNPAYPDVDCFNRTVVYVPAGKGDSYILDASNKYNVYNETPADLLNSFGLLMDNKDKIFKTIYIDNETPAKENVFINAEINADGIMQGQAQKSSYSYLKKKIVENYNVNGNDNYKKALKDGNNNLNILDLTIENIDIDSLPLKQNINFKMDLTPSGDGYIYFSPNLFTSFKKNPFLTEQRFTDIDFSYLTSNSIVGIFKIPAGYKTETLPKNTRMAMPDKSMSFTRIIAEQDGMISVRYLIDFQKSVFVTEGYPDFKIFYKKMYELLNEPIVLKKL